MKRAFTIVGERLITCDRPCRDVVDGFQNHAIGIQVPGVRVEGGHETRLAACFASEAPFQKETQPRLSGDKPTLFLNHLRACMVIANQRGLQLTEVDE